MAGALRGEAKLDFLVAMDGDDRRARSVAISEVGRQPRERCDRHPDGDCVIVMQIARMAKSGLAGDVISRLNFADAAYWTGRVNNKGGPDPLSSCSGLRLRSERGSTAAHD